MKNTTSKRKFTTYLSEEVIQELETIGKWYQEHHPEKDVMNHQHGGISLAKVISLVIEDHPAVVGHGEELG